MKDVTARKCNAARANRRQLRLEPVESVHVVRRVACPALTANVLVEAAVAVGDNVEAGQLLVPQVNRERVYVLLAVARGDHRVEKRPCAEVLGVPTGSRQ